LSEYVTELIDSLEPNAGLFLMTKVEITDISVLDDQSFKMIANMIAHNIEEGDGYTWTIKTAPRLSTCYENVGTFYFGCSQSYKLARDYKESNRQRMKRFDCHGKLIIKIEIKRNYGESSFGSYTTSNHLRDRFDMSKITMQQIYYWWSFFAQNFYKSDENHIISTHNTNPGHGTGCELCFELINDQMIAIGFTTPLLNNQLFAEIHCDATYNTAKG
ncbi:20857_t:CDS:2, partial [Gigaspora rosea]